MGCLIYNLWERIWRFSGNGNPASRQFPNFPFFFPIDRIMLLFFFSGVCFCGTGNRRKKKKSTSYGHGLQLRVSKFLTEQKLEIWRPKLINLTLFYKSMVRRQYTNTKRLELVLSNR